MSFILDALRKSETERQQQQSAEFASVAIGRSSRAAPRWIWLAGILIAINVAVLVGLFMREDITDSAATDRSILADTAVQEQVSSATTPSFAEKVATARSKSPSPAKSDHESGFKTVVDDIPATGDIVTAAFPTIHTIRANGAVTLPDLHLDIHVYSNVPKDRFVFINMSKYREGSQLDEGPVVHEITTEGVVLGHRGLFFLLPRD